MSTSSSTIYDFTTITSADNRGAPKLGGEFDVVLWSNGSEQSLGYYSSPSTLEATKNLTIVIANSKPRGDVEVVGGRFRESLQAIKGGLPKSISDISPTKHVSLLGDYRAFKKVPLVLRDRHGNLVGFDVENEKGAQDVVDLYGPAKCGWAVVKRKRFAK